MTEQLIHLFDTCLSDAFKEAHGIRPRGVYKEWWTQAELEAEYQYLSEICEQNMEEERKAEKQALIKFNELISDTIMHGAADRETAIRWLVDGEDLEWNEQDLQYFFWGHGLSYEIQNEWSKSLMN